jgi:hypothetical protein
VLLYSVVESSLVLDVSGVDISPVFQEEVAEGGALYGIDETGAPVVVGAVDVGPVLHQVLDDLEVRHEARGPHGGSSPCPRRR